MATAKLFKEKKARLELMEKIFELLDQEEKWASEKMVWFTTDEPRLDGDGNPKTREDGSIIYKEDYRYETIPEDKLDEDAKLKLTAIQRSEEHTSELQSRI